MNNFIVIMFLTLCSCVQPSDKKSSSYADSLKLKENELLKRELELKEKELQQSKQELDLANKKDIPISELYKQVKSGVFILYTQGLDNISQGTGFFLNNSGVAISNFHVLGDADKAIVILDNGDKCLINKIIEYNKDLDYVIFQVENQANSFFPLHISDEIPEIGSTCFAIGNPKGLTQTLSIGNISGFRDDESLIQTTTEITHGSSGGPLFNTNGQVIGITSSGLGEANLNFALNINRVPYQTYLSSSNNSTDKYQSVPISIIKSTINNYYTSIFSEDYTTLSNLYTSTLARFFGSFNISKYEAVNEAKNYKSRFKIISVNNKINWATLNVVSAQDGTFYVTFNMDYFIQRIDSNKNKTFNLDIIMTITKEMKIRSIYENIIQNN